MSAPNEMTLAAWRLRLVLYLIWVAGGTALASVDSLDSSPKAVVKFSLGLLIAVVGAWRTFLDRSTPADPQPKPETKPTLKPTVLS